MDEYQGILEKLIVPCKERNSVNNPSFTKWNDKILKNLNPNYRYDCNDDTYGDDDNAGLFLDCEAHVKKHAKPLDSDNVVVLTHPLFMFITHSNRISFMRKHAANSYTESLSKLFYFKSSIDANIVVFDTIHHYADSTSKLLEDGFIDNVFFTGYNNGIPNDLEFTEHLTDKNLYFAGAYNRRCLSSTVRHVTGSMDYKSKWCISDLILNSPEESSFLKSSFITSMAGDPIISLKYAVTLDGFLDRFKR